MANASQGKAVKVGQSKGKARCFKKPQVKWGCPPSLATREPVTAQVKIWGRSSFHAEHILRLDLGKVQYSRGTHFALADRGIILLNNPALFTNDTLSGPIEWKVLVRPSISVASRGWIQLFVSNSRNQNILINPSQITACAAKVVIVIGKVKLLNVDINITKNTLYIKVAQSEIS